MNNDLISREALKEEIDSWGMNDYEPADFIDAIDNAPTVIPEITEKQAILLLINNGWLVNHDKELREKWERPQGEWIPVSERLPEYSGLYLISIYDLVTVANFTGKYFCDRQMDKFVDVMAWQPLPEPYKKGGAENG